MTKESEYLSGVDKISHHVTVRPHYKYHPGKSMSHVEQIIIDTCEDVEKVYKKISIRKNFHPDLH